MEALFYIASFAAGVLLFIGSVHDIIAAARSRLPGFVRGHLCAGALGFGAGSLLIGHAARWVA